MNTTGLTYELICRYPNARVYDMLDNRICEVYSIGKSNGMIEFQTNKNDESDWGNYNYFKLVLKRLDEISKEDAIDVADLCIFTADARGKEKELLSIQFNGGIVVLTHLHHPSVQYSIDELPVIAADLLRSKSYCTEPLADWWIDESTAERSVATAAK